MLLKVEKYAVPKRTIMIPKAPFHPVDQTYDEKRRPKKWSWGSLEKTLDCAACHKNEDRHFGLFGADCSSCHQTSSWNLPEFRHPSTQSMDCAQCHQAPPSHYMEHFHMISAKVAGKPHARVDQCFACHQTTSWIDIKRVGVYKHH